MSHEIRTPMNGVMGMAELLSATELTSKQRSFADTIVKSGDALLTIINDILDFSKIDAGQMKLSPAPFDLVEAIEDVATLISAKAAEKELELAVRVDPALPKVFVGDAGRIRQVVTNLVGNAIKFTQTGHVLVDVSGGDIKETGSQPNNKSMSLHIRVEDTGVGISEEKCESVFDKFNQVDNSAARNHEGTGLGLSISKSLVKMMGGEIGVESIEGAGSTFWFSITLPIQKEESKKVVVPINVSGESILVVDDNAVNRAILEEQTTAWGFNCTTCAGGEEALEQLRTAQMYGMPFDIVIMDYHMPGINGVETTTLIRADKEVGTTPIIMLTSVDQTETGEIFSELNIHGHLVKPAKSSLLLEYLIDSLQAGGQKLTEKSSNEEKTSLGNVTQPIGPLKPIGDGKFSREEIFSLKHGRDNPDIQILVAEDNEVNKSVFRQILEGAGYSFEIASNGKEAVEMYRRLQPKLILMDVSMPVMSGHEATIAIRKLEQGDIEKTPIIGVTAHVMNGDMERCFDVGMDDFLAKPISPKSLIVKIKDWLDTDSISNLG